MGNSEGLERWLGALLCLTAEKRYKGAVPHGTPSIALVTVPDSTPRSDRKRGAFRTWGHGRGVPSSLRFVARFAGVGGCGRVHHAERSVKSATLPRMMAIRIQGRDSALRSAAIVRSVRIHSRLARKRPACSNLLAHRCCKMSNRPAQSAIMAITRLPARSRWAAMSIQLMMTPATLMACTLRGVPANSSPIAQ